MAFLISCETSQPDKSHHLSSYRGMEEHVGAFGNKALVKKGDPERLKRYERVIIEDVRVILPKNTDPKVKKASRQEAEVLAEKFEDILEAEFAKSYEITRSRSYKTITIRAALTDLEPSNPALFAVNYMPYAGLAATGLQVLQGETKAIGAGSAEIEIEVLDSRSRRQLYAMVDRLEGGKLQPGSLSKYGQAEMAMQAWARKVRKAVQGKSTMIPVKTQ
ncbi:MAG: DUF3313 domain-containing protein [Verrucomicrobiales bacterium]|nr:DUF3313 domain-containing protein [Verrucomicrobiales bacterium]